MAGDLCGELVSRSTTFKTPAASGDDKTLFVILAVVNILIPGLGMIIEGAIKNELPDLCIGLLQLFVPFVGWIWGIIWGIVWLINLMGR